MYSSSAAKICCIFHRCSNDNNSIHKINNTYAIFILPLNIKQSIKISAGFLTNQNWRNDVRVNANMLLNTIQLLSYLSLFGLVFRWDQTAQLWSSSLFFIASLTTKSPEFERQLLALRRRSSLLGCELRVFSKPVTPHTRRHRSRTSSAHLIRWGRCYFWFS